MKFIVQERGYEVGLKDENERALAKFFIFLTFNLLYYKKQHISENLGGLGPLRAPLARRHCR